MTVLAILLLACGLLVAYAFGSVGIVVGALLWVAAGAAFWSAHRRRLNAELAGGDRDARPEPRPGWQLFLIIVACVVVSIGGLFALGWKLTAGLADCGTGFFEAVKAGDMNKAHTYLSRGFRSATSDEQLVKFLETSQLDRYESVTWSNRRFNGGNGETSGTLKTKNGTEIPVTLTVIREDGAWKILHIQRGDDVLVTDSTRVQPNIEQQKQLVRDTTNSFANAIQARDFTNFVSHCAAAFQAEADAERMREAFKSVIDANIDLEPVARGEPEFTKTGFTSGSFFGIEGNYPLGRSHYYFRYVYVLEEKKWKLIGINVQIR